MINYPDVDELQELKNLEIETEKESQLLELTLQSRGEKNNVALV